MLLVLLFLASGFSARLQAQASLNHSFADSGLPNIIEYLKNRPEYFFYGLIHNTHNPAPSFFKKRFSPSWRAINKHTIDSISKASIRGRFELSFNPLSWLSSLGNYEFKAHLSKEKFILPQFSFSLGQIFYLPLYSFLSPASLSYENLNFGAVFPSLSISKSTNHFTKLFLSYTYVYFYFHSKYTFLKSLLREDELANLAEKSQVNLQYLSFGFSILSKTKNIETTMLTAFNLTQRNFLFKIEQSSKYIAWGFSYAPNDILVLRPYVRVLFLF